MRNPAYTRYLTTEHILGSDGCSRVSKYPCYECDFMGDNRQACLDHFRDVHGLRLPDQPQQTNIEKPQSVKVLLLVHYYNLFHIICTFYFTEIRISLWHHLPTRFFSGFCRSFEFFSAKKKYRESFESFLTCIKVTTFNC